MDAEDRVMRCRTAVAGVEEKHRHTSIAFDKMSSVDIYANENQ